MTGEQTRIAELSRLLAETTEACDAAEEERDRLLAIIEGCPRCSARVALTPEALGEDT